MPVTYDWSPVFNAFDRIAQQQQVRDQQRQYGSLLDAMFGQQTSPDTPAGHVSAPLPPMTLPGASVTAANPAAKSAPIPLQPMQVGGGAADISTPALPGQTSYTGPLG